MKPIIAITLGDPGGIGPEVVEKALRSKKLSSAFNYQVLGRSIAQTGKTKRGAQLAYEALETGIDGVIKKKYAALVTGPVCKESLVENGFPFLGQTEFLAESCGLKPDAVTMAMISRRLKVFLVSTHVSLRKAIGLVQPWRLERTVIHALSFLKQKGKDNPKLVVAGLNPHAGENGLLGNEEKEKLEPWLKIISKKVRLSEIPLASADTVFYHANRGRYDGVVCLYHDQGLIPFKLLA